MSQYLFMFVIGSALLAAASAYMWVDGRRAPRMPLRSLLGLQALVIVVGAPGAVALPLAHLLLR